MRSTGWRERIQKVILTAGLAIGASILASASTGAAASTLTSASTGGGDDGARSGGDDPAVHLAFRRLPLAEYRDKMKAGWIGQMVGVSLGAPTEFKFRDRIMPEDALPPWRPELINDAFDQDDLYVEMTFLGTLDQYGLDVSIRRAGIDFANSRYRLWCANAAGRKNLRLGIAPPDSSHPEFTPCPHDIDYQIEADYSGLVAPGLPNRAIALGETFGRLMNHGDGLYAGQFMGGMYAEAFFTTDIHAIIAAGLACIPAGSQYAEMVRDLTAWHAEHPDDWQAAWKRCQAKYREDPAYQRASNGGIDCKINGAYVLMGLLFGEGDPDRALEISCRCGQDSDCNPSSAAGVLFTTLGASDLPARFIEKLDERAVFSHTDYDFPGLLAACERIARKAVLAAGGRIEKDGEGREILVIPVIPPRPSRLVESWNPPPPKGSRYTEAEQLEVVYSPARMQRAVQAVAPGWSIRDWGFAMDPGLHDEALGRMKVLVTHPPADRKSPCVLERTLKIPAEGVTTLVIEAGHDPRGDWALVVRCDGGELLRRIVGPRTTKAGWLEMRVDLSSFAGRTVKVEVLNQPTGWAWEAAFWSRIGVDYRPGPKD